MIRRKPLYRHVSIDIETSGYSASHNDILEIAVIEFDKEKIGKNLIKLCKPRAKYIHSNSTAIHGISYDMVRNCPHYSSVHSEVMDFIRDRIIIGHNIKYDLRFINFYNQQPLTNIVIDTLDLCRKKYGKGGNKLKLACQRLNIIWEDSEAHRSRYDTLKCIELFNKLTLDS